MWVSFAQERFDVTLEFRAPKKLGAKKVKRGMNLPARFSLRFGSLNGVIAALTLISILPNAAAVVGGGYEGKCIWV